MLTQLCKPSNRAEKNSVRLFAKYSASERCAFHMIVWGAADALSMGEDAAVI